MKGLGIEKSIIYYYYCKNLIPKSTEALAFEVKIPQRWMAIKSNAFAMQVYH